MATRTNNPLPPNYMVQLPDDAISTGYRQIRPFHHEQVFRSASAGFEGTEREFLDAGKAYAYTTIDNFTRHVWNGAASGRTQEPQ